MPVRFNADVELKLEVGFNSSGPYDTGFTWTDISGFLREFDTDRGRLFELDDVPVGVADFVLVNDDRRFDADSTGAAYHPNVKLRKPVRFQAIHSGTTYGLYYGYVGGWNQRVQDLTVPRTVLTVVDGQAVLGPWETSTTGPEEEAHVRVGRLLDSANWTAGLRQLDTGGVTVAAYSPVCADVLQEIGRVAKTEDGLFFMDTDGNATFHTNSHRTGSTSIVTITDTGGGLNYTEPFVRDYDDKQVWNDVTVAAVGVTPQAADSTASVDAYGRRKMKQFDTLHVNATGAQDTAAGLVARFKDPVTRIPSVTLDGQSDTGLWPHVLGRDISDRVTVRHASRSSTTGTYSADHHVEGVRHVGSVNGDWTVDWLLSPAT